MKNIRSYQAILAVPFGMLGIFCEDNKLAGIDFLAPASVPQAPQNAFAASVCLQLAAYFDNPEFSFSLPLKVGGTPHQKKVWQAMVAIRCGETRQYGEMASALASSPRAVGQACGANAIPIVIPCHRVVGKAGGLSGYRWGVERKAALLEREMKGRPSGDAD